MIPAFEKNQVDDIVNACSEVCYKD